MHANTFPFAFIASNNVLQILVPLILVLGQQFQPILVKWELVLTDVDSVQRGGRVEIIANDQGHRITPSWVSFTDEERL